MSKLELTDVRKVWAHIKPDIEALRNEFNLDWKVEDVYAQCLYGQVFLWGCSDGFVIVKPRENPFTLEKELFVWICVSHCRDVSEYFPEFYEIAKQVHCTTVVFESPREGFRRWAKANNVPSMTTYRMPVV